MEPLNLILSWQILLVGLAVYALTFVIRTIVEYRIKNAAESHLWSNLVLPILPICLGGLGGCLHNLPVPDGLVSTTGHVIFGLVGGMLSGLFYKVVTKGILAKLSGPQ